MRCFQNYKNKTKTTARYSRSPSVVVVSVVLVLKNFDILLSGLTENIFFKPCTNSLLSKGQSIHQGEVNVNALLT